MTRSGCSLYTGISSAVRVESSGSGAPGSMPKRFSPPPNITKKPESAELKDSATQANRLRNSPNTTACIVVGRDRSNTSHISRAPSAVSNDAPPTTASRRHTIPAGADGRAAIRSAGAAPSDCTGMCSGDSSGSARQSGAVALAVSASNGGSSFR